VADLIDATHNTWNVPLLHRILDEPTVKEILTIPVRPLYVEDKLVWPATKDGMHTVKSNYRILTDKSSLNNNQTTSTSITLWRKIWSLKTAPKVRTFLWSLCQNAVASRANLFRRSITSDPYCQLCNQQNPETVEHLILLCPWTRPIWTHPAINVDIQHQHTHRFDVWLAAKSVSTANSHSLKLLANVCWHIWKMRNSFLFRNQQLNSSMVVETAVTETRLHQITSTSPSSARQAALNLNPDHIW